MQRLVADLLAYSRVESQGKELEPVAMEGVLTRVLNMFGSKLRGAGATVEVRPLPTVLADGEQLFLLFQNLIGNAVKFRAEAPLVIAVDAALERDRWRVSVKDNGIGIDPQYTARIFQMFQRLHGRDQYEGSGIGLTIVKRIVERHRGRIWLESQLGQGATFHFTMLPAGGGCAVLTPDRPSPMRRLERTVAPTGLHVVSYRREPDPPADDRAPRLARRARSAAAGPGDAAHPGAAPRGCTRPGPRSPRSPPRPRATPRRCSGIGHVGTRYATDVVLQFQAELAVAHAAVSAELPEAWAEANGFVGLVTRVTSHREFLLRPDLGRRLSDASLADLHARCARGIDVQLVVADGLSAVACAATGKQLHDAVARACEARGLRVGTPVAGAVRPGLARGRDRPGDRRQGLHDPARRAPGARHRRRVVGVRGLRSQGRQHRW